MVDSIKIPDKDKYDWIKKIDSNAYSKNYSVVIKSKGKEYKFPDTGSIASHYVYPVYAVDTSDCILYFNYFEHYLIKLDLKNGFVEKKLKINNMMIDKEYEMHHYYNKLAISIQEGLIFFEIGNRKLVAFNKENLKVMFTIEELMKEKILNFEKVFIYDYDYEINNGDIEIDIDYVLGWKRNGLKKSMTIKKEIGKITNY